MVDRMSLCAIARVYIIVPMQCTWINVALHCDAMLAYLCCGPVEISQSIGRYLINRPAKQTTPLTDVVPFNLNPIHWGIIYLYWPHIGIYLRPFIPPCRWSVRFSHWWFACHGWLVRARVVHWPAIAKVWNGIVSQLKTCIVFFTLCSADETFR